MGGLAIGLRGPDRWWQSRLSAIVGGAIGGLVLPDARFLHDPEPPAELVPGESLREALHHVEDILERWARGEAEDGDAGVSARRIEQRVGEADVEGDQAPAFLTAEVDQIRIGAACKALLMDGGDVVAGAP